MKYMLLPIFIIYSCFLFFISEVLLSSEARVITYVSKQGQRSEHSLDDVLQTGACILHCLCPYSIMVYLLLLLSCATVDVGRVDIAKRLKYTKDIMYRLINTQTK